VAADVFAGDEQRAIGCYQRGGVDPARIGKRDLRRL
jgi:hypothetical protein